MISIEFDQRRVNLLLLNDLVEIVREVVHNNVQILRITFVSEKTVLHDEIIRMFEHRQYLMLSIFVFLVLKDFLDGNSLSCLSVGPEVHNTKSSFPCYSLYLVFAENTGRLRFLSDWNTIFGNFIRLGFQYFLGVHRFVGIYFEIPPIAGGLLGKIFWINIDKFRFWT